MKRDKFIPTKNSYLCGGHFIASDYKYVDSIKLNDNAVPSIFKLPEHFMKIVKTMKSPVKRKFVEVSNSVTLSEECSNTCSNSNTSTNNSPSKEELKEKLIEHKKKIRVLQQKVRRKERRISDINNLLQDLKSKELLR